MKRFKFRLQSVLDVAEQRERGVQHQLVQAATKENEIRRQLDETVRNWQEWEHKLRGSQAGAIDVKRVKEYLQVVRMLQKRIHENEVELHSAKALTARIRDKLTEAAKERRCLERLREKRQTEHSVECAAVEVKQSDDLVNSRMAAARSGGMASDDVAITGATS